MAKTRVTGKIEWFDGVIGTNGITTMTPGSSPPAIAVQRRGARNSSMAAPGRSGRVKDAADTEYYWTVGDGIFAIDAWLNFKRFGQTTGVQESWIFGGHRAAGQMINVHHRGTGELVWFDAVGGQFQTGSFLTRGTWVYLSLIIQQSVASGITNSALYRMNSGGSALTLAFSRLGVGLGGQPIDRWQFFNSSIRWAGMVSALSLYQLDALGDATIYPSDIIQPLTTPITINFGVEGVATNDGSPSSRLPLDDTRINDEVKYGTLDNDIVNIDSTNGAWDHPGVFFLDILNTSDLVLNILGEPKMHEDISGSATVWTLHSGTIWKIARADATGNIAWENNQKINHPVGADITAVAASLEASTGMYADAGFLYLVATDHSNPNSNGKTYVRSHDRAGLNAMHIRNATNLTVNNWFARYTAQVDKANNNLPAGGAIAIEDTCTGFINLVDCGGDWCGEQCFGRGTAGSNLVVRRIRCRYPTSDIRLHPYAAIGSAQPDVDEPTDSSTTQTAEYINCTCGCSSAWTAHSDLGKMALVTMSGCNFNLGALATQGVVTSLVLNSGTYVGPISNYKPGPTAPVGTVTVNNGAVVSGLLSGAGFTFNRGSIFRVLGSLQTGNLNQQMFGTNLFLGNTIDWSGAAVGDGTASVIYRIAVGSFTFGGCILIGGGLNVALTKDCATGEVVSDDNTFEKLASDVLHRNYNAADRTGTQFVALGFDTHSQFVVDAGAPAKGFYHLNSKSVARGTVSLARWPQLASKGDFRGKVGPSAGNISAGAFEYQPNNSTRRLLLATAQRTN